jgi:putative transposase
MGIAGSTGLLKCEGWPINVKQVQRLYRVEGLVLTRRRMKRRRSVLASSESVVATKPNERRAMDFVHDVLATAELVRVLTVIGCYSRECVALGGEVQLQR